MSDDRGPLLDSELALMLADSDQEALLLRKQIWQLACEVAVTEWKYRATQRLLGSVFEPREPLTAAETLAEAASLLASVDVKELTE